MKEKIKKIKKFTSAPFDLLSPFHIEADKSGTGIALSVSGVKSVMEFSSEAAKLKCGVGSLYVRGKNIDISVYENKTVEISGKVETVEFNYAKN